MQLLQLVADADADADVVGMSVCVIGVKLGWGARFSSLRQIGRYSSYARGVVDVKGRGLPGVH